ncbi:MAG: hypothetical protein M0Q93_00030 [Terrimicrobiaceae bacterium]|jgi:hypothetical protein|nr:hypothetical protein [Terrimicrobiaceae bacterium]
MNYPIIIIEGPDATGKTTWAEAYCKKFNGRKLHLTLRKAMHAHQVAAIALAAKWSKECPVVIDRHWPSENIYAGAYRKGTHLIEESQWTAKVMASLGVFYVVALMESPERMIEAHKETFTSRKEMYSPSENYRQVVLGYWDWWFGTSLASIGTGYCRQHAPACAKYMATYQYDRDQHGKNLGAHIFDVNALALAWRKHCMSDKSAQRLAENRDYLEKECGLKRKKRG